MQNCLFMQLYKKSIVHYTLIIKYKTLIYLVNERKSSLILSLESFFPCDGKNSVTRKENSLFSPIILGVHGSAYNHNRVQTTLLINDRKSSFIFLRQTRPISGQKIHFPKVDRYLVGKVFSSYYSDLKEDLAHGPTYQRTLKELHPQEL